MSPTVYFISMGAMFGTIIIVFGIRFLQASAVAGADGPLAFDGHSAHVPDLPFRCPPVRRYNY